MNYPKVKTPTCVLGYVHNELRLESIEGGEAWGEGGLQLWVEPIHRDGREWGITHLQKKSRFGFLMMWPFCLHMYFFWRKQDQDNCGNWVPGTEQGIYARSPGWRWDVAGTNGNHWIKTGGYFGGHWD